MRLRIGRRFLIVLGWCGFLLAGRPGAGFAGPQDIPITVTEWNSVARIRDPVTTGIPIAPSQAAAQWALFDGNREIPLQTTVLPHRTTPWLLLDFQLTLHPREVRLLTLRPQAPTAPPPQPVAITEQGTTITVTTGPLRTQLDKATFDLLDRVWVDRDGNGSFAGSEQVVTPNSASNLVVEDVGSGALCRGEGPPARVEWEYRGPMRATLRVDGSYKNGTTSVIDYTTRLTWFAGRSDVRIDHVIRNSLEARERYVKLASARLVVGSGGATLRIPRSGAFVWTNVPGPGATLELIPSTFVVSTAYDPDATPPVPRTNTTADVAANRGLVIGDLSHHGATWQVDFASLGASESGRRATAAADPLVALAESDRYAELDAFGLDRFGTYDDEKNSYRRWGWTWPTPGNIWSQEHDRPRVQDLYPSWSVFDATYDPESDELWQNIIMLSRVRIPFYLDRLRAWARYVRWEWAYRTDGYNYAGAWGVYGDGPGTPSREPVLAPPLTALDNAYIRNNIKRGKPGSSHMWNGGVLDDYYLTGDRDALEAAIDVAEQCERYLGWRTPETGGAVAGNARFQARCLLVLVRTWEATDDARWRAAADHAIELFVRSPFFDPRGFFYAPVRGFPPAIASRFSPDAKLVTPLMMSTVVEALHRYFLVTQDTRVRDQLLRIGEFARVHGLDPVTGYCGDELVVDFPSPGAVTHITESQWLGVPPIIPYAAAPSSECFINALIIRYRLLGERSCIGRAKIHWDRASKREWVDPYDRPYAGPNQVGRFANSLQAWPPTALGFPSAGDWTSMSLLFGDAARADTTSPGMINDLSRQGPRPNPAAPGTPNTP